MSDRKNEWRKDNMHKYMHFDEKDNIACSLVPLEQGSVIDFQGETIRISRNIPEGHKFAVRKIRQGENLYKYGYIIGSAARDILPGEYVHVSEIIDNVKDWHDKYRELIQREDFSNG
jgi:altronate hydrolase